MKVLRVISGVDPTMGGPPVSSVNSAIAAKRAGVETTVAFPVDSTFRPAAEAVAARLQESGIPAHMFWMWRLFPYRARRWGISFPLTRWVFRQARKHDLVHAHGGWTVSTVVALAAARAAGRPAVLTPHESLTDFDILKSGWLGRSAKRVIRHIYRRSFDLIVVSSELERRDTMGAGKSRGSVVIYHPVVANETPSRDLPGSPTASRVGFLGRLDPKKNADVLVRALALMPSSVTLKVAGAGPIEQELRRLAHVCGVSERVEWLGFIGAGEKRGFFGSIDVLAMPSANECFGVSAAEAMVHGVPVVVSPTVGLAEVIERSGAGLVANATPQEIAEALSAVLLDADLRRALGSCASKTAALEFSFEAHGVRLRDAYEQLLRSADHAPATIICGEH